MRTWVSGLLKIGLVPLFALAGGCSAGSLEDEGAFLKAVRADIPSASAYSDSALVDMGSKICDDAPATQPAMQLLEQQYNEIVPKDRERLAYLALTKGCPERSGSAP
jgi:hypothetical protein